MRYQKNSDACIINEMHNEGQAYGIALNQL